MSDSIEKIDEALGRLVKHAFGESGPSFASIPASPDHDADLILARAIRELAKLRAEVERLMEALRKIGEHPHCVYPEHLTNNDRQYDIGVTDGHRCAATIARAALAPEPAGLKLKHVFAGISEQCAKCGAWRPGGWANVPVTSCRNCEDGGHPDFCGCGATPPVEGGG